jgi:hypothetical protein
MSEYMGKYWRSRDLLGGKVVLVVCNKFTFVERVELRGEESARERTKMLKTE